MVRINQNGHSGAGGGQSNSNSVSGSIVPQIIPVGKYKGQPLEVLANDRQYADWLIGQDWFKAKYPQFVQVIVNNFCEPNDTPEHNAMQARFLDKEWRLKFIVCVILKLHKDDMSNGLKRTANSFDLSAEISRLTNQVKKDLINASRYNRRRAWTVCYCSEQQDIYLLNVREPAFETGQDSIDVEFSVGTVCFDSFYDSTERVIEGDFCTVSPKKDSLGDNNYIFHIEIKPIIGDNYPSFLRQIKRTQCRYLLYREFRATSVSEDVVRKIFATSGVLMVSEADIEAVIPPVIPILTTKHQAQIVNAAEAAAAEAAAAAEG